MAMANKYGRSGSGGSGNSKIRFIMLEADLADGDLNQITQAISSAMRQPAGPVRLLSRPPAASNGTATPESEEAVDELAEVEATDDGEDSGPPRPRVVRRYPTPNVLDLDLKSGEKALDVFLTEKEAKKMLPRYLAIAYWFKQYRGIDAISVDHAYTAFRKMSWGVPRDVAQPLRDLARAGKGKFEGSLFSINHLGVDAVEGTKGK